MSVSTTELVTILVVDDDTGHCELVRRHLRRAGLCNPVVVEHSGAAALAYIRGRVDAGPLFVLLDINMPGAINGVDALRELKSDPATRKIPIIMLTTAENPREIERCYELGCNAYVTKPVAAEVFAEVIRRIGLFIEIVRVVPVEAGG